MDARDQKTWVPLELTKPGELLAARGQLASRIRRELGADPNFPVFVPYARYTKGGRTVSVRLIEGYAFVATGVVETAYFALERSAFVEKVFSTRPRGGLRVLQTIPDSKIREMEERLRVLVSSEVERGAQVRVTGGNYARLQGVVVDVFDQHVSVHFPLRSLQILAVLPKAVVETVGELPEDVAVYEDEIGETDF